MADVGAELEDEGSSQHSDVDTDMWSSDSEQDAHLHTRGEFFGCYLLLSQNPKFKGRVYIGFTVDPNRRLKQHNLGCHKGGARKTSGRGPWEMVLLVHGFPNHIAALRFEWAWQHPAQSRRLGKSLARKKKNETQFQYRFRVLTEMLSVGPWCRLPLTIRWLKQEYQLDFSAAQQPPIHMPIAFGRVDLAKAKPDATSSLSQPSISRGGGNVEGSAGPCSSKDPVRTVLQGNCHFCIEHSDNEHLLYCYHKECTLSAHVTCLAPQLSKTGGTTSMPHLIPVSGMCPRCGQELQWGELVRRHKAAKRAQVESAPKKKKKLSMSQPVRTKKHAEGGSNPGRTHWSEALHLP